MNYPGPSKTLAREHHFLSLWYQLTSENQKKIAHMLKMMLESQRSER